MIPKTLHDKTTKSPTLLHMACCGVLAPHLPQTKNRTVVPTTPPSPVHTLLCVLCACVVVPHLLPQAKRNSSGASKSMALGMIALGTDKGSISLWDLKRGALAHSLGEVCAGRKC